MATDDQIAVRRALWSSQFNANEFGDAFAQLCEGKDPSAVEKQLRQTALSAADAAVEKFLTACVIQNADPASLLRNLFWALPRAAGRRTMHASMAVACVAEACGLCKICQG